MGVNLHLHVKLHLHINIHLNVNIHRNLNLHLHVNLHLNVNLPLHAHGTDLLRLHCASWAKVLKEQISQRHGSHLAIVLNPISRLKLFKQHYF